MHAPPLWRGLRPGPLRPAVVPNRPGKPGAAFGGPDHTHPTWWVSTLSIVWNVIHAYYMSTHARRRSPASGRMGLRPCPGMPLSPGGHCPPPPLPEWTWLLSSIVVPCYTGYACAACRYLATPDAVSSVSGQLQLEWSWLLSSYLRADAPRAAAAPTPRVIVAPVI